MALKTATKTGSAERVIRTVFQTLVAAVPTIPVLTATLHLSTRVSAEVVGFTGVFVIIISALHNGLETAGLLPAMLKTVPLPAVTPQLQAAAQVVAPSIVTDTQRAQSVAAEVAPVVSAVTNASA
jgi:hypothetical protein